MCGIGGFVSRKQISSRYLIKISEMLKHRGPDDEGYYIKDDIHENFLRGNDSIPELFLLENIHEEEINVSIGLTHRRLSIIDLSPNGHQPLVYNDSIIIVYNGEIYNYLEIKKTLEGLSHVFHSNTDTEVIAAAYMEWGISCVDQFVGMWSFVIFDKRKNQIIASRDRFGIKPLYYFYDNSSFIFASEIKALLVFPEIQRQLHIKHAIEYLAYGENVFNPDTLFKDINELPPGNNLQLDVSSWELKSHKYYDLEKTIYGKYLSSNSSKEFLQRLDCSVTLNLRSDVPVGTCLSGGLDSSAIVALMEKKVGYRNSSFTASYPNDPYDETNFVKILNKKYPFLASYCLPDSGKFWDEIDLLTWHQDLPMNSTSPYAQWEVMKLAKSHGTKVLLDGQGADEIIGGYSEFAGVYFLQLLKSLSFYQFFKELKSFQSNYETSNVSNDIFRSFFHLLPDFLKTPIYSGKRIAPSIIDKHFLKCNGSPSIPVRIKPDILKTSLLSIQRILPNLLRYEDRNSMAFSIEARVPFLDHRFVEYVLLLPYQNKIHNGWTKYIMRNSLQGLVPEEIIWRKKKIGFSTPENSWKKKLDGEIRDFVHSIKIPEFINKEILIKMLNTNIDNNINLNEFWRIILFLKWIEIFHVDSDQ